MPITFGRIDPKTGQQPAIQGEDDVGEALLSSEAVVLSRGPALFRHVDWLEWDIATDRERARSITTTSPTGYINQHAGLSHRATAVARLYEDPVANDVIVIRREAILNRAERRRDMSDKVETVGRVYHETHGHVLKIVIDNPTKKNSFKS